MNSADEKDLKQLALAAELARPLVHECNNFLNNVLLQLTIAERALPEASRGELTSLRREGRKIANLFQQWQRLRKPTSAGSARIDFAAMIQAIAIEFQTEFPGIRTTIQLDPGPLWLIANEGEVQRLLGLLLGFAVDSQRTHGPGVTELAIRVERSETRILVRFLAEPSMAWSEFEDLPPSARTTLSLPALACRSILERLGGVIRIESSNDKGALCLDLPLASL